MAQIMRARRTPVDSASLYTAPSLFCASSMLFCASKSSRGPFTTCIPLLVRRILVLRGQYVNPLTSYCPIALALLGIRTVICHCNSLGVAERQYHSGDRTGTYMSACRLNRVLGTSAGGCPSPVSKIGADITLDT